MSGHGKSLVKQKGIAFDKTCETCHGPGSLHAQAAGDRTNPGFATVKLFKSLSSKEVNNACFQCHQDQRRIHWQGGAHESRGLSCVSCHSVHEAKSAKANLKFASEPETCFQCHKNIKGELHRNSHMPILEGKMNCGDCHNPHGSATNKMLVGDNVNQLCVKCHAE